MTTTVTLESAISAFDHWRDTRASRKEAIPDHLREQAIELLSHYKQSHIIAALKINHAILKRWRSAHVELDSTPAFVPLTDERPLAELTSSLHITLKNSQGGEMCIAGHLTTPQLIRLAESFMSSEAMPS